MKRIRKNNKVMVILLVLVGIFVWGLVMIRVFGNKQDGHGYGGTVSAFDEMESDLPDSSIPDTSIILNIEKLRDPFAFTRKVRKRSPKVNFTKAISAIVLPPDLKYLGFIKDEDEPFALIQLPDTQTIIMKEGDNIQEFYINKITMDSVIISKENQHHTFFLSGE